MPTWNYGLFEMAERMHQSVRKVLSGYDAPMTHMEYWLWNRYRLAQARIRQQQRRG